jgi:hypothetical protein
MDMQIHGSNGIDIRITVEKMRPSGVIVGSVVTGWDSSQYVVLDQRSMQALAHAATAAARAMEPDAGVGNEGRG